MAAGPPTQPPLTPRLGHGQVMLPASGPEVVPPTQFRTLYRLSDPVLSELGLEDFLSELLMRVKAALGVDTAAILLYDEPTQELVARAASGIEEEVEQGVRIPIGHGFAGRIAAERVPVFIADVDHADILNPILRAKGIRSLLGVPLIVEGELIGVLHVGALRPRTFTSRDAAVLQIAAARAAPGIERARLYSALEHEHRTAMILQRSLLPKQLVDRTGVSAAARYLPATDEVGGDWYDVFDLPGGRLGIAIGDVVGHGLRAATLMGQLRTALHAYALEDHPPATVLERLDAYLQALPEPGMATAAYAVLNPEAGTLRLSAAGHLPPIVVGSDRARRFDIAPSPPLGVVPFVVREEHELALPPGMAVMLYTDGLVEQPGGKLDEAIDALAEAVGGGSSAEEMCQLAAEMIPLSGLRDDIAIVAVQNLPVPVELDVSFSAAPHVLVELRRLLRRWLAGRRTPAAAIREITMAVNEACANAIEHAYAPRPASFSLRATETDGTVTIVVRDSGEWRAPRGDNRGRGLTIMRAAMDSVDVRRGTEGTEIVLRRRITP